MQARQIQQLSFTLLPPPPPRSPLSHCTDCYLALSLFPLFIHTHTAPPCIPMRKGRVVASLFQLQRGKEWPGAAAPLLATSKASQGGSRGWAPLRLCAYYWHRPPPRTRLVCYWQEYTHTNTQTNPHTVNKTKATNTQSYGEILTTLWLCQLLGHMRQKGLKWHKITNGINTTGKLYLAPDALHPLANYNHWHISTLYALLHNQAFSHPLPHHTGTNIKLN